MHDLVRGSFLEHPVLVNARLVGEGVAADDRLVPLHADAGDAGNQAAGRHQSRRVDGRLGVVVVAARPHRHHDFLQRAVARPFANAVDGAFDLAGARFDRRQAIGDREAQVVVAMYADDRLVDVRHAIDQRTDDVVEMLRRRVADRVGDVDRRRAGGDRLFDHAAEKVDLRPARVLGRKLDVVAVANRPLHSGDRPLDDFLGRHFQFEFAMDGAGGEERRESVSFARASRLPRRGRCPCRRSGPARRWCCRECFGRSREPPRSRRARQWGNRLRSHRRPDPRAPGRPPVFQPNSCSRPAIVRRRGAWCQR